MQYANHIAYSDVNPFEVVKVISDKTIEIREMDAVEDNSVAMEFIPGGFSAICTNIREQKWNKRPTHPTVCFVSACQRRVDGKMLTDVGFNSAMLHVNSTTTIFNRNLS